MHNQADIKHILQQNKYLIAVAVLVFITIYLASITEQDKMISAQANHDHEQALLVASKLLKRNPDNIIAKNVIKKSGQLLHYLQEAKLTLNPFHSNNVQLQKNPEKLAEGLQQARSYIAKAKAIDPKSKRALAFELVLDMAEEKLTHILSRDALVSGKFIILLASDRYKKITKIVNATKYSTYLQQFLTFQSLGAATGKSASAIKASIKPHFVAMEKTSQFISNASSYNKGLSTTLGFYIATVAETVDAVLASHGTFKDFVTTADSSMAKYKKSLTALKKVLADDSVKINISNIVKKLNAYKVFHDHEIYNIVSTNKPLFA